MRATLTGAILYRLLQDLNNPLQSLAMDFSTGDSAIPRPSTIMEHLTIPRVIFLTIAFVCLPQLTLTHAYLTSIGFCAVDSSRDLPSLLPSTESLSWTQILCIHTFTTLERHPQRRPPQARGSAPRKIRRRGTNLARRTKLHPPPCVARHLRFGLERRQRFSTTQGLGQVQEEPQWSVSYA